MSAVTEPSKAEAVSSEGSNGAVSGGAETVHDERMSRRGPIQSLLVRPEIGALLGAFGVWVVFWSVSGRDIFGTAAGTATYLDVAASTGIMAVAVALLMIGGEFDLSSGAMTGATGMLVILLAKEASEFGGVGLPIFVAMPITLAFALLVGWFNGTMVERTSLPSFIVTLGAFFMLKGGKLGFGKLFTDKVIVEGLDTSTGYDALRPVFASTWLRNDHPFESRDLVFLLLALLAAALVTLGLCELSYTRRPDRKANALPLLAIGVAALIGGVIGLHATDGVAMNWLFGALLAAGFIVALYGVSSWRYLPRGAAVTTVAETADRSDGDQVDGETDGDDEPGEEQEGSSGGSAASSGLPVRAGAVQLAILGVVGVVAAIAFAEALDSNSQTIVGFLATEQGLRGFVSVVLGIAGVGTLLLAGSRATAPTTKFTYRIGAAVAVAAIAFFVQSESTSVKFRSELFTVLLMVAGVVVASALLEWHFALRRHRDPMADRLGQRLAVSGVITAAVAIVVKLLFMTQLEIDSTDAQIVFRISILWFVVVTAFGTWLLTRTKFGSWVFAVGGNKVAARSVGVPAARTKTTLFLMVAAAGWLVGMLRAFRFNSIQADVGDGDEFFYIIAAVVGGNLLTGGYGSAVGGAIGALIIAMSGQGIANAGWNSNWRFLFLGGILLVSVIANNYVREKAEAARG